MSNRKAHYAGQFYPDSVQELNDELNAFFEEANPTERTGFQCRALIVPHAGYVFSGKVAARAYACITDPSLYKRIFLLGSSHRFQFDGVAVHTSGNYETPLGEMPVDKETGNQLLEASPLFIQFDKAHSEEHSLEVQVPFLQYIFGNSTPLIPLVLGAKRAIDCEAIAKQLKPYFIPENLFIISSDFSHYPSYENAIMLDKETAIAICSGKPKRLIRQLEKAKKKKISGWLTSLCGHTSVLTLMYLTKGTDLTYDPLFYRNSGDNPIFEEKEKVVGYWAIAVEDRVFDPGLTAKDQEELLEKARYAVRYFLTNHIPGEIIPPSFHGKLEEKYGCFVSLYVDNKLKGCVGGFAQDISLSELCQRVAVSACRDRRFDSISPDDEIQIEISILSPLQEIHSRKEIQPGKHGILVRKDDHSGTFLPQVAEKAGWSTEEFLGHCSRDKAGLGWDGWKEAKLYTYETYVFRD